MRKIYYLFLAAFLMPILMFAQPPVNDNCAGALPIEVNGDAVIADNIGATIYGPHGSCFWDVEDQVDGDVWFSITLTEPMMLLIETEEGTSDDSQLALFTIEDCGGENEVFTEIDCNDDVGIADGMSEILTDILDPGTYYLRASTWGDYSAGTYSISVSAVEMPENDTCEGAIELIMNGSPEIADNTISTINGPSGSCYGFSQIVGETWFMFTTTETMNVRVNTEDISSEDSQVSVFTIEGCGTDNEVYTEVGCSEDKSNTDYMSEVNMYNLAPGTYYIKAGTYHELFTGAYEIMIESFEGTIPSNSACADADIHTLEIDGSTVTVTGSGTDAVDMAGIGYAHVWEAFTIDDCADVTIDYCNISPAVENAFLSLYKECPVDLDAPIIAFDFDFDTCDNLTLTFLQLAAGTYYYPVMSTPEFTVLDEYSLNFTAVTCVHPDSCLYFTHGPWDDFNDNDWGFSGAPAPDENGVCETYQITAFEVAASELYIIDNFLAGETYTFSICEGPNAGSFSPSLSVTDPNGDVVAYTESCSVTWTAEMAGSYIIGITEVGACYSSDNTYSGGGENGYPSIACEGSVGLSNADKANFSVYPNPSNGQFTIGNVDVTGSYTIEVIDLTGRVIHSQVSTLSANTETRVNLDEVAAGVYMVKMINTNSNTQAVQRIVIK